MNPLITSLTAEESMALAASVAAVDGATAGKRATLKGFMGASALAESQGITLAEVCGALADGATRDGDKLLYRTISVIAKYITPWGILVLLGFGIFQALQTAKATATGFVGLMKKALSFLSPLKEIGSFVTGLFHDKNMDEDPAQALEALKMLVSANVPLFGVVLTTFEQNVSAPKKDARSITNQLGGGGYDKYQMGTIAYDGELDIAYDNGGNQIDLDNARSGDVVYDANGKAYRVDSDGDLVPV